MVDPIGSYAYIYPMKNTASSPGYEANLQSLESRVLELTALCDRLHKENLVLRRQLHGLQSERSGLIEKHELAKHRVEAMINRLKNLEEAP